MTPAAFSEPWQDAPEGRARQCFRALAAGADEPAPGLGAAQDAVLSLLRRAGDEDPRAFTYSLRVPVLLARGREGFLAWLRLERLEWGFGQFFPAAGTLLMPLQPDVRRALEEAWQHVLRRQHPSREHDVRWCLTHLPEENGGVLPIRGASLQAAVVVGLTLLMEGWPYDPTCAISATVGEDGALGEVDGITNQGGGKLQAALSWPGSAGRPWWSCAPGTIHRRPSARSGRRAAYAWPPRAPSPRRCRSPAACSGRPGRTWRRRPEFLSLNSPFTSSGRATASSTAAIARRDSIVRVKGARQMGRTSLLARGPPAGAERRRPRP